MFIEYRKQGQCQCNEEEIDYKIFDDLSEVVSDGPNQDRDVAVTKLQLVSDFIQKHINHYPCQKLRDAKELYEDLMARVYAREIPMSERFSK